MRASGPVVDAARLASRLRARQRIRGEWFTGSPEFMDELDALTKVRR